MSNIDGFAASLFEEAKRFLELARTAAVNQDEAGQAGYSHATIMLAFGALEAHVNAVADEMALQKGLSVHDKAVLLEKDVKLDDGRYKLSTALKMYRLEDRILFLHARFTSKPVDKSTWLPALRTATGYRNSLTHPKSATEVTIKNAEDTIYAIIESLDALYLAIYKKSLPVRSLGLHSKLSF